MHYTQNGIQNDYCQKHMILDQGSIYDEEILSSSSNNMLNTIWF